MNSKKLVIYEYDSLFEILNEIKDNLNFELIKADKNNFQNIESDKTSDFLIISNRSNEKANNFLVFQNLPIKIDKII